MDALPEDRARAAPDLTTVASCALRGPDATALNIAVIIPYYQHLPGILLRALQSVVAQRLPQGAGWHIVVIDDASPWPARHEVACLPMDVRGAVTILEQPNAGPGGARNSGLDWVVAQAGPDGVAARFDYVAFLDSDDTWAPDHLAEAVAALEPGYDLYFCNHRRFEEPRSYFDCVPAVGLLLAPDASGIRVIDPEGPVVEIAPEALLTAQLHAYLSHTSTVVVRASRVVSRRFDPELRTAGEDHHYWIGLAADGCPAVVSARSNVHCGRGVNVYFGALDWDSPRVVERVGHLLLFHHKIARDFQFSPADRTFVRERVRHFERGYSFLFVRALLKGRVPSLGMLRRLSLGSPGLALQLPARFLRVLTDRRAGSRLW